MDMDILSGDDVDLFDAIPFPLLDDDLTLNTKYLEYKNSDSEEDAISDDWKMSRADRNPWLAKM
jgi:hypothetical protein